jgi:hypothetical protein
VRGLHALLQWFQALAMIAGLVVLVGGLLYGFSWLVLSLVQFFPVIGRKHRHDRWTEMNQERPGRRTGSRREPNSDSP